MSLPKPSSNGNAPSALWQRIAIAAGALLIIALTIVAAILLATEDSTIDLATPTATLTGPVTSAPPPTSPSIELSPTATLSPTTIPSDTPVPTETPTNTPLPPTATDTPEPVPPTATSTPVIEVATATPIPLPTDTAVPTELTNCGTPPPPGWFAYTVQSGDTLDSLATRTGTSVFELQRVNCLGGALTIGPGQIIYLPFNPPTPTVTFTPSLTPLPGPTPTHTPTPISPQIDSVTPRSVDSSDQEVIITVVGRNFRPRENGFRVELRGPATVPLQLSSSGSDTSFDAIVPSGLPVGIYDLVVTNPNTERAGVRQAAFSIGSTPTPTPPAQRPRIDSVIPDSGFNNVDVRIRVDGSGFRPNEPGFRVQLRVGLDLKAELPLDGVATDRSFNAVVPAGLAVGHYDLWVINPDGLDDVEPDAYESRQP